MSKPMTSIWGDVQWCSELAPGIVLVSTASHGGIILDAAHTARVPREIEPFHGSRDSWEEDCDIAVPLILFAAEMVDHAREIPTDQAVKARAFLAGYRPQWLEAIDKALSAARIATCECSFLPCICDFASWAAEDGKGSAS